MPKRNGDYWRQRFDQIGKVENSKSAKYLHELEEKTRRAEQQIDAQINSWYQRFANNNEITITEAKRLLNSSELAELRWSVQDYIKHGQENAIDQRWAKELENASAKFHINRLEALKLQTRQQIEVMTGGMVDDVDRLIRNVYKDTYYRSAFEIQKGVGIGFDVGKVDEKKLSKLVNKPWAVDGKNFSERIWGNKAKLLNTLDQELSRMVLTGESPKRAIDNIKKAMHSSTANTQRLVFTEQAYFTSLAQHDLYDELDVEEFEFVGTLDGTTCELCGDMDGKHFPVKDMVIGVNAPPMHPGCRCVTCPYFDDEFTDGLRDSRNEAGETVYEVPEKMTYKEWKNSFVNGGSKEGLKPHRYANEEHKARSKEELVKAATELNTKMDDFGIRKSKWNNILEFTSGKEFPSAPIGECIRMDKTSSDPTLIHELLHTRSAWYYDDNLFLQERAMEEASVELMTREISKALGYDILDAEADVELLYRINSYGKMYETDLEFAMQLFSQDLPDRTAWLLAKINKTSMTEEQLSEIYNGLSEWGYLD